MSGRRTHPRTRQEAISRLPHSVTVRLGRRCESVEEAEVCCRVASATCGGWAAVLAASEVFVIPIQTKCDFTLEDVVWYVGIQGKLDGASLRSSSDRRAKRNFKKWRERSVYYQNLLDTLPLLEPARDDTFRGTSEGAWWRKHDDDRKVFPDKRHSAIHKVNLRFCDVWYDCRTYYGEVAKVVAKCSPILRNMLNDEATSWLMWLCGTYTKLGGAAFATVEVFALRPDALKALNTVSKSLGVQRFTWGRDVCELNTLAGRGVGGLDVQQDVRTRIDMAAFLNEKAAVCDPVRLRECIKKVCRDEMAAKPKWGPIEDYWSRRWLYTKSGSHTRRIEDILYGGRLDLPSQPTRREFAESVEHPVVAVGEARVDAGFSAKEEHGKTRAIYGCDSRSYFTFDYLLRPIEAVWRNANTLLDPGRLPQTLMYERLRRNAGLRYMLDFDDFNSQHTLEAMKMVIEVACESAPRHVREWCIESWDNMYVHYGTGTDAKSARMVGTLPSGHRATTFVNTILNAAYCLYASSDYMSGLRSFHCGDDVVVFGDNAVVSKFIREVDSSPFRVNPSKQSVGTEVGEFLRVSFLKEYAGGYGARGIASLVSGNWVTSNRLDKKAYIETLLRGLWTLCSRFGDPLLGALGVTSIRRRVPEVASLAYELCTHKISLNGTPVSTASRGREVTVLRVEGGVAKTKQQLLDKSYASDAFLHNHVDFKLLKESGLSPQLVRSVLRRACVKPREVEGSTKLLISSDCSNRWYGADVIDILTRKARGVRTDVEAFNILMNMFSKVDWQRIVGAIRGVTPSGFDTHGKMPWPIITPYDMPFSDAMSARTHLTTTSYALCAYPVRV